MSKHIPTDIAGAMANREISPNPKPPMDKDLDIDEILDLLGIKDWSMDFKEGEAIEVNPRTEAKQALTNYLNSKILEAYDRGVDVGMGRAKTAVTIAMNTGKTTMQELRAVIDAEIKWWRENPSPPENPNTGLQQIDKAK